jgi:hypothetical protein
LVHALTEEIHKDEKLRNYEYAGSSGRHYYNYSIDEQSQTLTLHNRNSNYKDERLVLKFSRPTSSKIILTGIDQDKNDIYVVLDKIEKKYLLKEAAKTGRRKGIKL